MKIASYPEEFKLEAVQMYIGGMSQPKVAEAMGCSKSAVGSWCQAAKHGWRCNHCGRLAYDKRYLRCFDCRNDFQRNRPKEEHPRYIDGRSEFEKNCEYCGRLYISSKNKGQRFCSRSCSHKEENNYNWRGSEAKQRKQSIIRWMREGADWRNAVFARDDYTCQVCGKRGVKLNAHHIQPLAELIGRFNISTVKDARRCEELWDIDNGLTLCVPCHELTDTFPKQFRSEN